MEILVNQKKELQWRPQVKPKALNRLCTLRVPFFIALVLAATVGISQWRNLWAWLHDFHSQYGSPHPDSSQPLCIHSSAALNTEPPQRLASACSVPHGRITLDELVHVETSRASMTGHK